MMFLPMIDGRLVMGMGMGMGDTSWSYLPLTFGVEEVPTLLKNGAVGKYYATISILICYSLMVL